MPFEAEEKREQSRKGEDGEQKDESGEGVNDPLTRREAKAPRTDWQS